ncbi:MAG: GNAT family N-acetyltransferase [Bacteroidales bacterium]|nr:GNAT family N-acetyltransferase [Bacteroidales bacterium]
MNTPNYTLRTEIKYTDKEYVESILKSSGFFRDDEIIVALELIDERLIKGVQSGYEFVFLEIDNIPVAYTCFGLIPCSLISYDLYWIGTHQEFRNRGLGQIVLKKTEEIIKTMNGQAIYIETSSKEMYLSTQKFYEKSGYELKVVFENFYDIGDGKSVFVKKI